MQGANFSKASQIPYSDEIIHWSLFTLACSIEFKTPPIKKHSKVNIHWCLLIREDNTTSSKKVRQGEITQQPMLIKYQVLFYSPKNSALQTLPSIRNRMAWHVNWNKEESQGRGSAEGAFSINCKKFKISRTRMEYINCNSIRMCMELKCMSELKLKR